MTPFIIQRDSKLYTYLKFVSQESDYFYENITDFCSLVRHIIWIHMIALCYVTAGVMLTFAVGSGIYHVGSNILGMLNLEISEHWGWERHVALFAAGLLAIAAAVVAGAGAIFAWFKISTAIDSRKDEPDYQPSLMASWYSSYKNKYCMRVEFTKGSSK